MTPGRARKNRYGQAVIELDYDRLVKASAESKDWKDALNWLVIKALDGREDDQLSLELSSLVNIVGNEIEDTVSQAKVAGLYATRGELFPNQMRK